MVVGKYIHSSSRLALCGWAVLIQRLTLLPLLLGFYALYIHYIWYNIIQ